MSILVNCIGYQKRHKQGRSATVRWVQVPVLNENVTIKETFLGFIPVTDGRAAGLVETTCKYIEDIGIEIEKLRGQAFDGASVMSGAHNGVQKLMKDRSSKPVPFVHCAAHNLNLVVNDAVNSVVENDSYVFFSSSINRSRDLQLLAVDSSLPLSGLLSISLSELRYLRGNPFE